jgi:hypothetical protein
MMQSSVIRVHGDGASDGPAFHTLPAQVLGMACPFRGHRDPPETPPSRLEKREKKVIARRRCFIHRIHAAYDARSMHAGTFACAGIVIAAQEIGY